MPETDDFANFTGRLRVFDGRLQQEVIVGADDNDPNSIGMHERREWRDVPIVAADSEPAADA